MMEHELLILLGRHPKVLTESLYALAVTKNTIVSQVTAIATTIAKSNAVDQLLNPVSGKFHQLCHDYPEHFPNTEFTEECILVARDGSAQIADIGNLRESQAYLHLLFDLIVDKFSNPNITLHCVVAGGRRTLSVYLSMIMQLLARPTDRLYHLVVDPWEVETRSDFYFPPRKSTVIHTADGNTFQTDQVSVDLVEIPFLRLRARIPDELLENPDYERIHQWVQSDVESSPQMLPLKIFPEQRRIAVGVHSLRFEPVELALYWLFAEISHNRTATCQHFEYYRYFAKPEADGYFPLSFSNRLLKLYRELIYREDLRGRFESAFFKGKIDLEHLRPHFSNIKRKIRKQIPDDDLNRWYYISPVGARGNTSYGIKLNKEFIRLPTARL